MTMLPRLLPCLGPVLVLALGAVPGSVRPASAQQEEPTPDTRRVRWETLRQAQDRAAADQKPLLIHFTAPWSGGCKQMHRETYRDPRVIRYLNEHFAMAEVDIEKLPALARKFAVEGLPTLWFLESGGRRLTRLDGFTPAENLLPLLEFIVARDYEWTDYATWLERRR
ncbi:MAG: thioredoxin family protein [Candidatus Krumholzibacteriia bacterium]